MQGFSFLRDILEYPRWERIEQINKGWSRDKKFYVERQDGAKLLLRVTAIEQHEAKQREFAAMGVLSQLGIRMSEPLDFGICGEGQYVYSLLTWLEGRAVEDVILALPEQEQYQLGVEAGTVLRRIHSVPAPTDQPAWEQRMLKKFSIHRERYLACGVRVTGDHLALTYIENNLHLLKDRPQTLQHGDYHVGNMIFSPDGKLGIIDFNRWDYGDPYEEFYKMMLFSREKSIPFVRGQLTGYFGDSIPDLFFRLLALYLADVILFSVVWAIPFGQNDVDNMLRLAQMVLRDYDGFKTCLPAWA